jgi:exodeoxyribonuclease III
VEISILRIKKSIYKNYKGNKKNSGFLPEERQWMTDLFEGEGWVDTYRKLHPDATDAAYTWWSNRGQAYAKNVGWRLDIKLLIHL